MTSYQNLFIAKIPHDATDADLMRVFAKYNPVSAKVMLDATNGTSKGFGFVLFNSEEEGMIAHKALDRSTAEVNGRTFTVNACPSKYDARVASHHSPSLYIRNIPRSCPQAEVEKILGSYGRVVSSILRDEPNGYPVWVIYVRYERQQDADAALNALHNNHQLFPTSEVPVLAKYAKQKSQGQNQGGQGNQAAQQSQGNAHFGGNSPQEASWLTPPNLALHAAQDFALNGAVYDTPNGNGAPRRRSGGNSPQTLSPTFIGHHRRYSGGSTPTLSPHQTNFGPNDVRRYSTSSFQYCHNDPSEEDTLNATQAPRKGSMELEMFQSHNTSQTHVAPGNVLTVNPGPQRSPTVSPTNKQIDANGYYRHSPYGFA